MEITNDELKRTVIHRSTQRSKAAPKWENQSNHSAAKPQPKAGGEPAQPSGAHFDGKTTACLLCSSCVASFLGYINIPRSETPCWKHKTHAVFCRRDKMRTTPALALPTGSRTGRLQSRNMALTLGMTSVCNGYYVSWGGL